MNWLEKNLKIIFRNFKSVILSSLIKTLFSTVQRAEVSYFLKLQSANLYSSCQDLNGHSWLDEMPSSLWHDRGSTGFDTYSINGKPPSF